MNLDSTILCCGIKSADLIGISAVDLRKKVIDVQLLCFLIFFLLLRNSNLLYTLKLSTIQLFNVLGR